MPRIDDPAIKALSAARYTWFTQAGIPVRFRGKRYPDMDFSHYDPAVVKAARRWRQDVSQGKVIGGTGTGLLLMGDAGHGKSMFASVLANELMFRTPVSIFQDGYQHAMRPVYFTSWSLLLAANQRVMGIDDNTDEGVSLLRLTQGSAGVCVDPAWNVKVLFLDDVGREYTTASGWAQAMLVSLLRTRFENGLPTVITSNVPLVHEAMFDWRRAYGDIMTSFVSESSIVLPLVHARGDQRL
jgi:DNA replication protein DnaC